MGLLDEPGLDRLVAAGCPTCGGQELLFRAYVDGRLPLLDAEPTGRLTWIYDGEKFVDGVYQVSCAACAASLFSAEICPRCHAEGGLGRALGSPNRWAVPARCPGCDGEELHYIAFVPARVTYQGRRADPARSSTELLDVGFHGARVDCRDCGPVAALTDRCPLCDGPGPLRTRPG